MTAVGVQMDWICHLSCLYMFTWSWATKLGIYQNEELPIQSPIWFGEEKLIAVFAKIRHGCRLYMRETHTVMYRLNRYNYIGIHFD